MRYVCFLQLNNGDIQVGSTNGLKLRIAAHRLGEVDSTRSCRPVALTVGIGAIYGTVM